MISIILVEPENPGNLGAVARAMKNFGFKRLYLIRPKAEKGSQEAKNRAKHAQTILKNAIVVDDIEDIDLDYKVGTSSKLGTDYNLPRTPMTAEKLSHRLMSLDHSRKNIGVFFGRESSGLTNKELEKMDFLVNIPTSKYAALNLSHAVTIVLYEIYQAKDADKTEKRFAPISRKEIDVILDLVDKVLDEQDFLNENKVKTQKILWKHMVTKSFLTRREAYALMGFLRKLLR